MWLLSIGVFVTGYLLGSIPFGYLVGRAKGIDIRDHGSHNVGATNVLRIVGKTWGFAVFFADALKGFAAVKIAVLICRQSAGRTSLPRFLRDPRSCRLRDRPFISHLAGLSWWQRSRNLGRRDSRHHAHSRRNDISRVAPGVSNHALRLGRLGRRGLRTACCCCSADSAGANPRDRSCLFLNRDDSHCRLAPSIKLVTPSPRNRAALHPEMNLKRTAILGAGSWGTALAVLWSKRGNEITLWGHNEERAARLQASRESAEYLPGYDASACRSPSQATSRTALTRT